MVGYNLTVLLDLPIYGLADSYLVIPSLVRKVGGVTPPSPENAAGTGQAGTDSMSAALAASRNTPLPVAIHRGFFRAQAINGFSGFDEPSHPGSRNLFAFLMRFSGVHSWGG